MGLLETFNGFLSLLGWAWTLGGVLTSFIGFSWSISKDCPVVFESLVTFLIVEGNILFSIGVALAGSLIFGAWEGLGLGFLAAECMVLGFKFGSRKA